MGTGENIRNIREKRGLSRLELAENLGVAPDYLESVEKRGEEASVSLLMKAASLLKCDLHTLLYGIGFKEKSVMLTRRTDRVQVKRRVFFDYESLAATYPGRHMEPFMIDVLPSPIDGDGKAVSEVSSHEGEEFHYVIEGKIRLVVDGKEHLLDEGDSVYFDSSLPHSVSAVEKKARVMAVIYNALDMKHLARSPKMGELIEAARHLGGRDLVMVIPNETSLEATARAMEEGIVRNALLVGDPSLFPPLDGRFPDRFITKAVPLEEGEEPGADEWQIRCAREGAELISRGEGHMLMKGKINTAHFFKQVLVKERGLTRGRRLSVVSIFEIPGLERLIFLTDPAINPSLFDEKGLDTARDIIENGIDVARAMGVAVPRVAILDANEMPSAKIPTSLRARELAGLDWGDAIVEGPLSYDLALYSDSAKHKGITGSAVAGQADILVVPGITGGNFLYKAWGMTMGAEYANILVGARVPLVMASRSDSDMTKFLTLCASAVYSDYTR